MGRGNGGATSKAVAALWGLLLTSCLSGFGSDWSMYQSGDSLSTDTAVVLETLDYWEKVVGPSRPFSLIVDHHTQSGTEWGRCLKGNGVLEVVVFAGKFEGSENYRDIFRTVLLHEMSHANLLCKNDDHASDPDSTLYPTINKLKPELSPDVLRRLRR